MNQFGKRFSNRIEWIGFDLSRPKTRILVAVSFGLAIGYGLGFFMYPDLNEFEDLHLGTCALICSAPAFFSFTIKLVNKLRENRSIK